MRHCKFNGDPGFTSEYRLHTFRRPFLIPVVNERLRISTRTTVECMGKCEEELVLVGTGRFEHRSSGEPPDCKLGVEVARRSRIQGRI